MGRKQQLGSWGEKIAADFLAAQGYTLLERNFRTKHGELDLIAIKDGVIVFVEVKTRSNTSLGWPEISVTPRKISHIIDSATSYLVDHPDLSEEWRVDVIAIQTKTGEAPEVEWFENALG
jgi:putative endonuclease